MQKGEDSVVRRLNKEEERPHISELSGEFLFYRANIAKVLHWVDIQALRDMGLNTGAISTPKISLDVYRIMQDTTVQKVCEILDRPPESMALTQNQITRFCNIYARQWFDFEGRNQGVFMLRHPINGRESLFVAQVDWGVSGLGLSVSEYSPSKKLEYVKQPTLVVPVPTLLP